MKRTHAVITTADRRRLGAWVATDEACPWGDAHSRDELRAILERARPVEAELAPENLVTMNTTAGLLVAFRPRIGAWVVAAWLWAIIVNLLLIPGFYDVALRDFALSLGAVALALLCRGFPLKPLGI